jgi:hypothetical protein
MIFPGRGCFSTVRSGRALASDSVAADFAYHRAADHQLAALHADWRNGTRPRLAGRKPQSRNPDNGRHHHHRGHADSVPAVGAFGQCVYIADDFGYSLDGDNRFYRRLYQSFKKDKKGLKGIFKILGQVGLGLIVGITMLVNDEVVVRMDRP